jgi:hypothetical protein
MMTTLDRALLARVLGMLGSDHPGEVLAAHQAERIRRVEGVTWPELLAPPPCAILRRTPIHCLALLDEAIRLCLGHPEHLTDWERDFLVSPLPQPPLRLSPKQRAVLDRIATKILVAGMAGWPIMP